MFRFVLHRFCQLQDLLSPILYPKSLNVFPSTPISSSTNQHLLRLFFNGTWRRVTIDGFLPRLPSGRPVGVRVRDDHREVSADQGLGRGLRLLEKGWIKVNGGWDFPGSLVYYLCLCREIAARLGSSKYLATDVLNLLALISASETRV